MTLPVTLAILLGGQSRRMGFPKHQLRHKDTNKTLLQSQIERLSPHFEETLLLSGAGPLEEDFELPPQVQDPPEFTGFGPLAGLLAAFRASGQDTVALLACDYPLMTPDFFVKAHARLEQQSEKPGVVYCDDQGHPQWLCGLYRSSLAPQLRDVLKKGARAVRDFASEINLQTVAFPRAWDPMSFTNLNTLEEAERVGYKGRS